MLRRRSGPESGGKLPVTGYQPFRRLLSIRRFLGRRHLEQHLEFGLLVLQHPEFRADPSLQIQYAFLVTRRWNGSDQGLNVGEPVAGIRECRAREVARFRSGLQPRLS